ncbi:MAG: sulfotransferase [Deltaproteobacteria bacterium]|nr:sulfotransferase [Deltaproteobacteria bacterium]
MKQVAFLCYINRSGSTFLAKLLDEYAQIGVTPEARIPDGIAYGGPVRLNGRSDLERFMDRLYADYKFRAWGIYRDRLKERISKQGFPVAAPVLLPVILSCYFKESLPHTVIYKCSYIRHLEAASKVFPEAKFIVLIRDLRAVYSSQKRSIDSTSGRPMADNPVTLAALYNQIQGAIERLGTRAHICVVRYEDLVADTEQTLKRLLKFLGVDPKKTKVGTGTDYVDKIVPEQKHLHSHVTSPPIPQRIDAWRHELSRPEILTLQKVSQDQLIKNGYALIPMGDWGFLDHIFYGWQWIRHYSRFLRQLGVAVRMAWHESNGLKRGRVDLIAPNLWRNLCAVGRRLRPGGR